MCHPTFGQALVLLRLEVGGKNHSTCRKLNSSFRERLGISIYNMRQGEGIRYETLFRDETVGALDATNAKEYVRMLRRAMDLGGFPLHYLIKSDSRSGSSTPFWSLPLSKPSAESACTVTVTLPARSARFAMAFHAENN